MRWIEVPRCSINCRYCYQWADLGQEQIYAWIEALNLELAKETRYGYLKIIYIWSGMCCTSSLKLVYLANYLPLWLTLELAGLSQQSLIACSVRAVAQSLLRGLGINVLRKFSSSDSGLLYHPKLITYQGEILWKLSPLGVHCLFLVFPLLLMWSVTLVGPK